MFLMPTLPGCCSGQAGQSDVRECLNPVLLVHILPSMFVCYLIVNGFAFDTGLHLTGTEFNSVPI